ncbi:uncharacterized protein J3D65DRAFT_600782 [Phyllosticta citribraziliensis]|uniref:Uncharacterized protein n=1 Tax=Phyllosticta citribraziliensis TaxID=989973 RepID=A0ABR1LZP7_9PEZI
MSEAGKSFEGTLQSTEDFFKHSTPDFFTQHADAAAALLANADAFFMDGEHAQWLREAVQQLARGWDQIPQRIRTWVEQHPWQTAFYVACGVVFVVPTLAYGPALGMMGFSAAGPVAVMDSGSLAAGIQSTFSPVVAGGVFATSQSAAMGGYGVGPVAALTQVGAVAAMTAVGLSCHAVEGSEKDDEKED